jgi:GMP synthase (glutamine-hydrolysing)
LIVDPSISWPEEEGADVVVGDWGGDHLVLRPALDPGSGPSPGTGYDADAVVLMGSRASVSDDLPWLNDLRAWLVPLLTGQVRLPLLGICFGHQLIAHAAGGSVGKVHLDGREERGIQKSRFVDCRLLPGGGPLYVVASHSEEIKSLPPGLHTVSRRDSVTIDALEHVVLPIFGVQFHPEARAAFLRVRKIPMDPREALAFDDQERILARFREYAWRTHTGGDT